MSSRKIRIARENLALGPCFDCKGKSIDRVFLNGNIEDISPNNLVSLCRSCHMIRDGRKTKLVRMALVNAQKSRTPPKPCSNCGTPAKPLRYGRCSVCAHYFRFHGVERGSGKIPVFPECFCKCGSIKDFRSIQCTDCRRRSVEIAGEKNCNGCNSVLPLSEFGRRRGDRWRSRCKECERNSAIKYQNALPPEVIKARKKEYKKRNPQVDIRAQKRRRLINQMGLSLEEANKTLNELSSVKYCEICNRSTDIVGTLHIDHCHETGKFRGFICGNCNAGLGHFQDNQASLIAAFKYLKKHQAEED